MAFEFTAEGRDHQANGFRGPCRVRNDVLCRGARGAKIFPARAIHQRLRTGIGMNGGHGTDFNFKGVVQGFCQRGEAVGGAGGDGDNGITGVEGIVIHVKDNGFHLARRGGDQHLLGTRIQMRPGFLFRGIKTGAFDDDIHPGGFPGDMSGLFFGVHRDRFAIHNQRVFGEIHTPRETAVVRVMPEQIGQHFGRGKIVDGDDGVAVLGFKQATKDETSDAPESVNANFTHGVLL